MNKISRPWFSYSGVRNTDLGVLMVSQPVRQHPAIQGNQVEIQGKQGKVFFSKESYGIVTVKQDIIIPDASKVQDVLKWLTGRGKLIFWDSPAFYYDAMILTASTRTPVSKRLDGQKMSITFTCQPFRKSVVDSAITINTSSYEFNGKGDYIAEPLIKVEGTGVCDLKVNNSVMQLALISGTPLYLDCDAGIAYTIDSNGDMQFAGGSVVLESDWVKLNPKPLNGNSKNTVQCSSGISKVTIYPSWRWF